MYTINHIMCVCVDKLIAKMFLYTFNHLQDFATDSDLLIDR